MHQVFDIWALLSGRQRRQLVALQLLSLLASLTTLGGIAAVMPFFSVLAQPRLIHTTSIYSALYSALHFASERQFVVALGTAFVALLTVSNLVNLASTLATNRFAFSVNNDFQVALFRDYLRRDLRFHLMTGAARLHNNVVNEVSRATIGMIQSALTFVSSATLALVIVISIAYVNSALALAATLALASIYAVLYLAARRTLAHNGQIQSVFYSERTSLIADSFNSIRELKLLHDKSFVSVALAKYCHAISKSAASTLAIAQAPKPLLESAVATGLVGAALVLADGAAGSGVWLAQFSFLALAGYRLLPALQQAFSAAVRIRVDLTAFLTVAGDLRRSLAPGPGAREYAPSPTWAGRPMRAINIRDVTFRYAPESQAVIDSASLQIRAGSMAAIVGANGSGKTTLVELILGLLDPDSGTIEVDGERLEAKSRSAWWSTVAYVPQSVFLFDTSLAQNVALGEPPDSIDFRRLGEALRLANLESLAASFTQGIYERLGSSGRHLSGGERQRVGLARALYRNASLLVLDEATSALDSESEAEIMRTIYDLRGDHTILVVTHHLETLRRCEQCFELANGIVIEAAARDELKAHA
jgi:HlyD family secretion protein